MLGFPLFSTWLLAKIHKEVARYPEIKDDPAAVLRSFQGVSGCAERLLRIRSLGSKSLANFSTAVSNSEGIIRKYRRGDICADLAYTVYGVVNRLLTDAQDKPKTDIETLVLLGVTFTAAAQVLQAELLADTIGGGL